MENGECLKERRQLKIAGKDEEKRSDQIGATVHFKNFNAKTKEKLWGQKKNAPEPRCCFIYVCLYCCTPPTLTQFHAECWLLLHRRQKQTEWENGRRENI